MSGGKHLLNSRRCLDLSCSDLNACSDIQAASMCTLQENLCTPATRDPGWNSHHGDINGDHGDVFKVSTVTVQLQIPALTLSWNRAKHWKTEKKTDRQRQFMSYMKNIKVLTFRSFSMNICQQKETYWTLFLPFTHCFNSCLSNINLEKNWTDLYWIFKHIFIFYFQNNNWMKKSRALFINSFKTVMPQFLVQTHWQKSCKRCKRIHSYWLNQCVWNRKGFRLYLDFWDNIERREVQTKTTSSWGSKKQSDSLKEEMKKNLKLKDSSLI